MLEDGTRGGGTGRLAAALALIEGPLDDGSSTRIGLDGSVGSVGDGAGVDANDEALDGMDACDGPLPLFHAAALLRASKLEGFLTSVPSSLAMTHPLLRLLE